MLTWRLDRIVSPGPLAAVGTFVLPLAMAVLVAMVSNVENVLGLVLVASLVMFVGSIAGSVVTSGLGAALFAVGSFVAEVSPALLLVVGCGLFATLVLHDVGGTMRRAPHVNASLWKNAFVLVVAVSTASALLFAGAYGLAKLATWQAIVVPFGLASIGFAAKLAADAHATSARQLTVKRPRS